MTDQEGNFYKTIIIGTQEWMAENLNTSIYRNGDLITTDLSDNEWSNTYNTQQGAWAYYNNDSTYSCPYGKLYNFYACNDSRSLCPLGWHVPSEQDWRTMINYLDPNTDEGNNSPNLSGIAMKSTGTIEDGNGYWYSDDSTYEGTNNSGFSGIPGGGRGYDSYFSLGGSGLFWSNSAIDSFSSWYVDLSSYNYFAYVGAFDPVLGFSVRCLRD
jgi:uncharacterized protein (TIGR02145 family)